MDSTGQQTINGLTSHAIAEVLQQMSDRLRHGESLNNIMNAHDDKNAQEFAPLINSSDWQSEGTPGAMPVNHDPHASPPMLPSMEIPDAKRTDQRPARNLLEVFHKSRSDGGNNQSESLAAIPTIRITKKASQLKRSFSELQGRAASGKKLVGEYDPENREILRLRQEQNLEFDEIANILNKKRVKVGVPPALTSNAVYSRYKRNGPLIAASEGRDFVPTPLDKKANGVSIHFRKAITIVGFNEQEDEMLVRAVTDIESKKWELVSARLEELSGNKHEAEMCALRFNHL